MTPQVVKMNKPTAEKFQHLLHCGCKLGTKNDCECQKIPLSLARTWVIVKRLCDRMGHGGRNFSDESMALMVALSGVRDDLLDGVTIEIDGAELREQKTKTADVPNPPKKRGRPPTKKQPVLMDVKELAVNG